MLRAVITSSALKILRKIPNPVLPVLVMLLEIAEDAIMFADEDPTLLPLLCCSTATALLPMSSHCSRLLNQFCLDQLLPTRRSSVATGCRGIKATIKTGAISYFHPGMQKRNTLEGIEIRHRAKICLSQAIAGFSSRTDWIARNPN